MGMCRCNAVNRVLTKRKRNEEANEGEKRLKDQHSGASRRGEEKAMPGAGRL